ncbi:MAG: hypothetical protein KGO81_03190 [Bacteroidota bacterium]|nr:hypothetical protein [Bacteroidota bacterium]
MKKIFVVLVLVFSIPLLTIAQNQKPGQTQRPGVLANVQGLKIAYITRELNLSTDEAQKFWPVYYGFNDEMKAVRQKYKDDVLGFDEASLSVKKKYYNEFKKVLGSDERANKVFMVDRNFGAALKRELDKRKELRKERKR